MGIICFLSSVFCLAASAWGCPACKDAVASPTDPAVSSTLTQSYARSIYFLMAVPYLLFAGITFLIVRSARRHRKQ